MTQLASEIKIALTTINAIESVIAKRRSELDKFLLDYSIEEQALYDSQIYQGTEVDQLLPIIIFVETIDDHRRFEYYRYSTSSMPQTNVPGHNCKILVQDSVTKQYLGVMQLTTDLLVHPGKTTFLGIPESKYGRYKTKVREKGINISICVPLQPFGFNFCGGKLLAMLAFSTEVYQYFQTKYQTSLGYIMTTSINGKSIQYSQLKELKYVGLTQGFGTSHIPESLMPKVDTFLKTKFPKRNLKKDSKTTKLKMVVQDLKLDPMILYHGQKRGVYIGFCGEKGADYVQGLIPEDEWIPDRIKDLSQIFQIWLDKYALKRKKNLLERKALKLL